MLSMLDEARYWDPTCRALGMPELIERYPTKPSAVRTGPS